MGQPLIGDGVIDLRPLSVSDALVHWQGCDCVIVERLGGGVRAPLDEVRRWVQQQGEAWDRGAPVVDLGVVQHDTDELAGCVGIQRGLDYLRPGEVNITYAIYPQWRRQGLASRAVLLAEQLCLQSFPQANFVIRVAPQNQESIRVARRTGHVRSHTTDDEHGHLIWYRRAIPGR